MLKRFAIIAATLAALFVGARFSADLPRFKAERALAQIGPPPLVAPLPFYASTYTGPGNVVSGAAGWWGLRAYNAAYCTGSNDAATIRRASDNTTKTIVILSNCTFDVNTASTFCSGTTCYVTTLYDQSGNGNNMSQSTNADQPQLVFNCISSLPCMEFAATPYLTATKNVSALPVTMATVMERYGDFSSALNYFAFSGNGTSNNAVYGATSANTVEFYAGSNMTATMSDSAQHSLIVVAPSSGNSTIYVDDTATSGNAGNTFESGTYSSMGAGPTGGQPSEIYVSEFGIWASAFTSTQAGNMCHNQYEYWGTSTSC